MAVHWYDITPMNVALKMLWNTPSVFRCNERKADVIRMLDDDPVAWYYTLIASAVHESACPTDGTVQTAKLDIIYHFEHAFCDQITLFQMADVVPQDIRHLENLSRVHICVTVSLTERCPNAECPKYWWIMSFITQCLLDTSFTPKS